MKRTKSSIVLPGLLMVVGLSGCALFNSATVSCNRTTTIGQELLDLQEAKEKGVVSEEEYEKLKKQITKCCLSDVNLIDQ